MAWFRMHAEFVDDPKVQRLSPELFKFWVNCLGISCQNKGVIFDAPTMAWKLKLSEAKTVSLISDLHSFGLLDQDGQSFTPHNWVGRQYSSDVSTNRVKRFRERQKHDSETFPETNETVSGNAPEQNRTEQIPLSPKKTDVHRAALLRIAGEIHGRHPNEHGRRDIGVGGVVKKLEAIAKHKKLSGVDRVAEWENINAKHADACRSEQWRKNDGEFAKSLVNWLAPTVERYEADSAPAPKPQPRLVF